MKRLLVFAFSTLSIFIFLTSLVLAKEATIYASSEDEILDAVSLSNSGDTVNINLKSDIEVSKNITISKGITLNVYFNGYQINYTGSNSSAFDSAAIYMTSAKATVNLYGSHRLDSYSEYTHYSDDVRPDFTGTGNLIVIQHGSLNIESAYMLSSSDAFIVAGDMVDGNDYTITVKNSVLRTPEGSSKSAMVHEGGNSSTNAIVKRIVISENSVLYGGFKGISYAYNLTTGTSFTNTKFYDFYIKNDCWYSPDNSDILPHLMNTYEKSASYTHCIFNNYDETVGDITVYTETGKQNFKLIECTFGKIVNGGKFSGDRGGNAIVYIIEKMPSCNENGKMKVCTNGGALTEQAISKGAHNFEYARLTYKNGYTSSGEKLLVCAICAEEAYGGNIEPIFTSLGYSLSETETDVSIGTKINVPLLQSYLTDNPNELFDYGIIAGGKSTSYSLENGALTLTNGGIKKSFIGTDYDLVTTKLTNIVKELQTVDLALEFYICDGESVEICDGSFEYITVEELKIMLDETRNKALKLLDTKHKLYYNDDGSFRVLVIADAHMNYTADSAKVNDAQERIKILVDRVEPNLVIFTGDNTIGSSSEEKLRANLDVLVSYIEEKEIYWCHTYGNHDHEGSLSNAQQQPIYESYEYCVSKAGDEDIFGTGNYVLGVYNKDDTLGAAVYCFDSGAYASGGGYDFIKDDQIAWYKESSELLEEYNGKKVPSIMAFHIPLRENITAYEQRDNKEVVYEYTGQRNEGICASNYDNNFFETVLERGDVKAIVTGHDHINDYMYNYMGVKLASSPNVSDLTYTNASLQGGRVFDLNASTINDIPTYVEYVIERVNPYDYEIFNKDVVIEDGSGDLNVSVSGYNSGGISGTANVTAQDGAIAIVRSQTGNFEIRIKFDEDGYGRLGENKYVVLWMDFSNVEFRKACIGLLSVEGSSAYRTDDHDANSPFYYLADGSSEWVELSHGGDGCFGSAQGSSVLGLKGYFAMPVEYMKMGSQTMNSDTLVTGFYMYADIKDSSYEGVPFYIDNVMLVGDYKNLDLTK